MPYVPLRVAFALCVLSQIVVGLCVLAQAVAGIRLHLLALAVVAAYPPVQVDAGACLPVPADVGVYPLALVAVEQVVLGVELALHPGDPEPTVVGVPLHSQDLVGQEVVHRLHMMILKSLTKFLAVAVIQRTKWIHHCPTAVVGVVAAQH